VEPPRGDADRRQERGEPVEEKSRPGETRERWREEQQDQHDDEVPEVEPPELRAT
jgi:hypothetical protein